MNILLINHYAGSPYHGMEFRPYYMAREWIRAGHQVTIAGSAYSHLRKEAAISGFMTEEIIDGIRYVWLRTPHYKDNGVKRAVNMFSFVAGLASNRNRIACGDNKVDIVIASSTYPLDIFPAWLIAREQRAKLIFEVHDLWPLTPIELGGVSKWHPFIMVLQLAENFACRNSDAVVSMLPLADAHLGTRGMAAEKYRYIPNGVVVEDWDKPPADLPEPHQKIIADLKHQGRFLVGYAGAHGVANSLATLVDAAALLADLPVTFLLVGQGPEKVKLENRVRELHLENVVFLPPVAKNTVPALLSAFDAQYIGLQKQPLFRFGISPNKLMDYMMTGRPVIHAIEAANNLVAESGCGLSVPPENPEKIAEGIKELMAMSPAERDAMGRRGREYMVKNHDYKVLADRFLAVMRNLSPASDHS